MAYIEIKDLVKSFPVKRERRGKSTADAAARIEVLKGVSLSVEKGGIFGIIGLSGAGKSTLARCVNRLETPDSGSVTMDGTEILKLPKKELGTIRQKIGMIF